MNPYNMRFLFMLSFLLGLCSCSSEEQRMVRQLRTDSDFQLALRRPAVPGYAPSNSDLLAWEKSLHTLLEEGNGATEPEDGEWLQASQNRVLEWRENPALYGVKQRILQLAKQKNKIEQEKMLKEIPTLVSSAKANLQLSSIEMCEQIIEEQRLALHFLEAKIKPTFAPARNASYERTYLAVKDYLAFLTSARVRLKTESLVH